MRSGKNSNLPLFSLNRYKRAINHRTSFKLMTERLEQATLLENKALVA